MIMWWNIVIMVEMVVKMVMRMKSSLMESKSEQGCYLSNFSVLPFLIS